MKRIIVLTCATMLMGCSRHKAPVASVGFVGGSIRDSILHQLRDIHATVLTNSAESITADFQTAQLKERGKTMRVNLTFKNDRLAEVNYVPLWLNPNQ